MDRIVNNLLVSEELAGGGATSLNWIDPSPLDETDRKGVKAGNQILQAGEFFVITGNYRVLKVDRPSNGIYVKIGSRGTWLTADKASKLP